MALVQFEHTHLGAYLVGTFSVACLFTDSAQGFIERNQLNRKWLLLYGALCFFAYLYARPFIRVGLGSAKRGYINFSTLYIVWLCSAVFYHLPSLEQLGLDVRADVSMLIVLFLSSLAGLTLLAGLHTAAVSLSLLPRRAYLPEAASTSARSRGGGGGGSAGSRAAGVGAAVAAAAGAGAAGGGLRELWILLLLNSMIIAVACSTYHSFCGNGTLQLHGDTPAFKAAVCVKWLHPILTADYPRFASWMLYGEGSAYKLAGGGGSTPATDAADADAVTARGSGAFSGSVVPTLSLLTRNGYSCSGFNSTLYGVAGATGGSGGGGGYISVDFPLDGRGVQSVPAGDVLSPVLSMWVTLVAAYIANTLAGQARLVQAAAEDALSDSSSSGTSRRGISGSSGSGYGGANNRASVRVAPRSSRSETATGGNPASTSAPSNPSSAVRRSASDLGIDSSSVRQTGVGLTTGETGRAAAVASATVATVAVVAEPAAAGGGNGGGAGFGEGGRKSRHRALEIKKPISKGLSKAAAAAGSAASGAVAAARRSLSSLRGLAASTSRIRRAASDCLLTSHPYLPTLLGQVRRGMAALEPSHLAAELAEATGLPPDLARALTRGSSSSVLMDGAMSAAQPRMYDTASASVMTARSKSAIAAVGIGGAGRPSYPWAFADAGGGDSDGSGDGSGDGDGFRAAGVASTTAMVDGPATSPSPIATGQPLQPEFLDMVPWYSGTSADLFKTLFDLMVSVKLFLGRFDMRTMQAATAASMADSFNDTPSEGDGFTYEHLDERPQLWLDCIADTGDGGNPTYAVAAALAAPALTVTVPHDLPLPCTSMTAAAAAADSDGGNKALPLGGRAKGRRRRSTAGGPSSAPRPGSTLVLPRGDVLLFGGDLAYPNPSRETYQQRLFRPFSDALPPPPHFHPGRLVVHKPDLAPAWGVHEAHLAADLRGLSPRSSRRASSAALRRYPGPTAFAIPGNHDWIDGLETFTREIQHKGWLGGWLLPQEKSYFALRLPAGWWLFGFDLALVQDIDMQQYRYFANVVEQRMEAEDQVILMSHEPLWLLEWFWQRRHGTNLRQLVRGHLRGRARLHLAGDLHFYMRHSWTTADPAAAAAAAEPPCSGVSSSASRSSFGRAPPSQPPQPPQPPQPQPQSKAKQPHVSASTLALRLTPPSPPPPYLRFDDGSLEPGVPRSCLPARSPCAACEARQRWVRHPHDPEHLVVNGGGGAFLHPTHVFAGARFRAAHDPAADATAGLYAAVSLPCTCGIYSPGAALYGGASGGRMGPSWVKAPGGRCSPPQQQQPLPPGPTATAATRETPWGGVGGGARGYAALGPDGEYVCASCYPSPRTSMQLGRRNLHVFRLRNTRFDVIGGVFYFLLVISVLPRCSHLAEVLEADSPAEALSLLWYAYVDTLEAILGRSYLSAGALALLLFITLGLARGGGVGAVSSSVPSSSTITSGSGVATVPAAATGTAAMATASAAAAATAGRGGGGGGSAPVVSAPRPLLAARMGGLTVQLAFAIAHCMTHLTLAIVLLLLLELGVATCIKYERLGADGPNSLYRWYRMYEEQHFPDPMGLRQSLQRWTFGLYPGVLQLAMGLYDVPELIAVARTTMCEAGGSLESISRLQAVSYYAGMLAYYWLLATPAMGFVFGLYLYISVCWCHVHYDEAFSSLREANCKSFCRLHIGPSGDLQLYTLALDEVPTRWQEDARWRGPQGGGNPGVVAHEAHYPSRWAPVRTEEGRRLEGSSAPAVAVAPPPAVRRASAASASAGSGGGTAAPSSAGSTSARFPSARWRLVDYVFVPRKQL